MTKPDINPPLPEVDTEQAVDIVVASFQRQIEEGAAKIREGLAIWAHVEEHTKRWLDELPGLLKAQGQQVVVSVGVVEQSSRDAGKRMKGEALPPVQVITMPKAAGA